MNEDILKLKIDKSKDPGWKISDLDEVVSYIIKYGNFRLSQSRKDFFIDILDEKGKFQSTFFYTQNIEDDKLNILEEDLEFYFKYKLRMYKIDKLININI